LNDLFGRLSGSFGKPYWFPSDVQGPVSGLYLELQRNVTILAYDDKTVDLENLLPNVGVGNPQESLRITRGLPEKLTTNLPTKTTKTTLTTNLPTKTTKTTLTTR